MNEPDIIVYGATFWGIGYAIASSKSVLVIEPTINPGHEYADTFCMRCTSYNRLQSKIAREFYDGLVKHGALLDGRLHPAALVPMLCGLILEKKVSILLDSVVFENREGADGRRSVSVVNGAVRQIFQTECLIDTLSPEIDVEKTSPFKKRICVLLHGDDGASLPLEFSEDNSEESPRIIPGRFPSEAVLQLPVEADIDFPEARSLVKKFWQERPEGLKSWKIATIGREFLVSKEKGSRVSAFFSQGYEDPLAALDAGVQEGMR